MARELKFSGNTWQAEFFDHILRSGESYSQKWDYVKETRCGPDLLHALMSGYGKAKSSR